MSFDLPGSFSKINESFAIGNVEIPFWSWYDAQLVPSGDFIDEVITFDNDLCTNYLTELSCVFYNGIYNYHPAIYLYKNGDLVYVKMCDYKGVACQFGIDRALTFVYPDILQTVIYNGATIDFTAATIWNFYRGR